MQTDIINPITPAGYARLQADIARMKQDRPALAAAVSETSRADGMGDISAAKQDLALFDHQIGQMELRLNRSVIVDPSRPSDPTRVGFGARVVCLDENDEEKVMVLVGPEEADPRQNRISWHAPVARALAGGQVGTEISVKTPRGEVSLQIIAISYPEA